MMAFPPLSKELNETVQLYIDTEKVLETPLIFFNCSSFEYNSGIDVSISSININS